MRWRKRVLAVGLAAAAVVYLSTHRVVGRMIPGYLFPPPQQTLTETVDVNNQLYVRDIGSPAANPTVKLLSFNVQRFMRQETVEQSIRESVSLHSPDVLLFQELPRDALEEEGLQVVFGGKNAVYAPMHTVSNTSMLYAFDSYGQATLSAHPIKNPSVIVLPEVNKGSLGRQHTLQRVALYSEVPLTDGKVLRVINVHNEPFTWAHRRAVQFESVLKYLNQISAENPDVQYVDAYCGDTNAHGNEAGIRLMERNGFQDVRGRGLDRCLFRGHKEASFEKIPGEGSDHSQYLFSVTF